MNQRLLIALVLSFLVLSIYGYLVPKPQEALSDSNKSSVTQQTNSSVASNAPTAPVASTATTTPTTTKAPVSAKPSSSKIITSVETKKYKLTIDSLGRIDSVILKEKKYKDDNGNQ